MPPPLSPRERDGVRVARPRVESARATAAFHVEHLQTGRAPAWPPTPDAFHVEQHGRRQSPVPPLPTSKTGRRPSVREQPDAPGPWRSTWNNPDPLPSRVGTRRPPQTRSTWNTSERLRRQPLLQDALHRSPPLKRVPRPSRYVPRGTRRTPIGPCPALRSRTFHVEHPETAKPFRARNEPPQAPASRGTRRMPFETRSTWNNPEPLRLHSLQPRSTHASPLSEHDFQPRHVPRGTTRTETAPSRLSSVREQPHAPGSRRSTWNLLRSDSPRVQRSLQRLT